MTRLDPTLALDSIFSDRCVSLPANCLVHHIINLLKKRHMMKLLPLYLLSMIATTATADDEDRFSPLDSLNFGSSETTSDHAKAKWSGEAELGFTQTSGNTETESLNGEFTISYEQEKWRNVFNAETLSASEDGEATAERYKGSFQTDYKLSSSRYLFAGLNYEEDRFSGFDFQASASFGYGVNVIENKHFVLALELGPGLRKNKIEGTGENEEDVIARTAARLVWQISDTALFEQLISNEAGESNVITNSETSLKVNINGSLALRLSLNIKNTSEVPVDVESTDTETRVTLVYSF